MIVSLDKIIIHFFVSFKYFGPLTNPVEQKKQGEREVKK
jgi:hypothetical protein